MINSCGRQLWWKHLLLGLLLLSAQTTANADTHSRAGHLPESSMEQQMEHKEFTTEEPVIHFAAEEFSYSAASDRGPQHWTGSCNTGSQQSPINIITSGASHVSLPKLHFEHYNTAPKSMDLLNNGDTVKLSFNSSDAEVPTMYGGGLSSKYKLAQLHFHWGEDTIRGSEHLVDNMSYPLEMHLLHYKYKFMALGDALLDTHSDTIAVLGVFFRIAEFDNPALEKIIEALENIKEYNAHQEVHTFPLEDLLPNSLCGFYRYEGSITVPGCQEIILWNVLKSPQYISKAQLEKFKHMKRKDGETLELNYRPTQPIGSRTVMDVDTCSGSLAVGGSWSLLLALLPVIQLVLSVS